MLNKREALKHEPLDAEACVMVHYGSASLANTRGGGSTATRASPPPSLKGANVGLVRRMGFLRNRGGAAMAVVTCSPASGGFQNQCSKKLILSVCLYGGRVHDCVLR